MDKALTVAARTKNVYVETSDTKIDEIQAAVSACTACKVLYASHRSPDVIQEHIGRHRRAIPNAADLELVMSGNAMRILQARKR